MSDMSTELATIPRLPIPVDIGVIADMGECVRFEITDYSLTLLSTDDLRTVQSFLTPDVVMRYAQIRGFTHAHTYRDAYRWCTVIEFWRGPDRPS